jgi:hypothetical protein
MSLVKLRRTSSSGTVTPPPHRVAPDSPDGVSLRASVELYSSQGLGNVHISKKIVVTDALVVEEMQSRNVVEVWSSQRLENSVDVWREESAPVDESLFISMSASIVTGGPLLTPRDIAKAIVRKILREGWLPVLQVSEMVRIERQNFDETTSGTRTRASFRLSRRRCSTIQSFWSVYARR